jgi:ribonuclease J
VPPGVLIKDSDVASWPARDILCLTTGSQGEPFSALSRIAIDAHRHVKIGEDDTVVLSARAIPGNEKAIGRVVNHLARRGAQVIHEGLRHVHVSGHGSAEELKLMLSLVRPRYFVPVHGEYRQLSQHARVARRMFAGLDRAPKILLAENGDILHLDGADARIAGKAPVGRVLIDGTLHGEIGDEVLRDRRHLAEDGLVIPVVAINKQTGALEGVPTVHHQIAIHANGLEIERVAHARPYGLSQIAFAEDNGALVRDVRSHAPEGDEQQVHVVT